MKAQQIQTIFTRRNLARVILLLILAVSAYSYYVAHHEPDPQNTVIIGQSSFYADSPASIRIFVKNHATGRPIPKAAVRIAIKKADRTIGDLGTFTTDNDGSITKPLAIPAIEPGNYLLEVATKSSVGKDVVTQPIEVKLPARIYLTTDKPLYQPGQTLHLRVMMLNRLSLKPCANQPITFEIEDPKGNKVFRETRRTSPHGISAIDFVLADEVNPGRYRIRAVQGGVESEKIVTVQKYVLPKFKIAVETDRSFYLPADTIRGQLHAIYFFGKPVAKARIEIIGRTMVESPVEILRITGQTDEAGSFSFTLPLPNYFTGMPLADGNAFIQIETKVIDGAGHEERSSVPLVVAAQPIQIHAIPEAGSLVPGVENILYILTACPDGEPVACTLDVNGQNIASDVSGIAVFKITPETSELNLNIKAVDNQGQTGTLFRTMKADDKGEFLLRTDKAVYAGGQSVTCTLLSATPKATFFIDAIKDGQTMLTRTLDVASGRGVIKLDLPPALFGTLKLNAYTISDDGNSVACSRLIHVAQPDQLNISVALDKPVYRPSETANLRFSITDKQGKPMPAALGLSAVDEAVFYLSENRPGLLEQFFLANEELLKPAYQLKFAVSPQKLWGGKAEDQAVALALFASAFSPQNATATLDDLLREMSPALLERLRESSQTAIYAELLKRPEFAHLAYLFESHGDYTMRASTYPDKKAKLDAFRRSYYQTLIAGLVALLVSGLTLLILWFFSHSLLEIIRSGKDPEIDATEFIILRAIAGVRRASYLLFFLPFIIYPAALCIGGMLDGDPDKIVPAMLVIEIAFSAVLVTFQIKWCLALRSNRETDSLCHRLIWIPIVFALQFASTRLLILADAFNIQCCEIPAAISVLTTLVVTLILIGAAVNISSKIAAERNIAFALTSNFVSFLAVIFMVFIFSGLLLPNLASVRERARIVNAMSELNGLDKVLKMQETEPGKADPAASGTPVRRYFPETLLWQPELITDDQGRAELSLPLADSITTWRMNVDALSSQGLLGSKELGIRVFQDFFVDLDLPLALTQNDEVSIPVVCHNYLKQAQVVKLKLDAGPWCSVQGSSEQVINLGPNEVQSAYFRIKALAVGSHELTVLARGDKLSDAVQRPIIVRPDGTEVENLQAATLLRTASHKFIIPAEAISDSQGLLLKLYPSIFSEIVEGLDNIFKMPFGCFEQTSSCTYPNVLALLYMKRTGQVTPEVEVKARKFINVGYQRLLTFEVSGGGFDWFGHSPANEVLTAYGLLEFSDMAEVHNIDPKILERASKWLNSRQKSDGSWRPVRQTHTWHQVSGKLVTTAYIAWAMAESGRFTPELDRALGYVRNNISSTKQNYTLALAANALLAVNKNDPLGINLVDQLESQFVHEDRLAHLESEDSGAMYSAGNCLAIETTALASMAMLKCSRHPETLKQALGWLSQEKDQFGTWYSTQATILAMKALLSGTGHALGGDITTAIRIAVNGQPAGEIKITPQTSDIFQMASLTRYLRQGENTIVLSQDATTEIPYQLVGTYWMPWKTIPTKPLKALTIATVYDRTQLAVNDILRASVIVTRNGSTPVNMAIIDLGIPPGFQVDPGAFDRLVTEGTLAKYELTGNQCLLYVRDIRPEKPIRFSYELKAAYPIRAKAPSARVYEYYNPQNEDQSEPIDITVK